MLRPNLSSLGCSSLLALAFGVFLALGCSQAAGPSGGGTGDYNVPTTQVTSSDRCASPAEGCPCDDLGAKVACSAEELRVGSFVMCAGERTCERDTGMWGTCDSTVSVVTDGGAGTAAKKH